MHVQVPPGIWTGFGIDFGPAFAHVTGDQVDAWVSTTRGCWPHRSTTCVTWSNANRRGSTGEHVPDGFETLGDPVPGLGLVARASRRCWARSSARRPRLLLAPIRNTLLAVPEEVDLDFVALLWSAVADGASDELDIPPLRWTGSAVVSVLDRALGLPN